MELGNDIYFDILNSFGELAQDVNNDMGIQALYFEIRTKVLELTYLPVRELTDNTLWK